MPHLLSRNAFYPGCTINRALIVRMGDLAIVPCHRTSYDQFLLGHFNVENDVKITDNVPVKPGSVFKCWCVCGTIVKSGHN